MTLALVSGCGNSALFADVEPLGPGTTREVVVGLAAGDSRGVVPLTQSDLIGPTMEYRRRS